ncbi:M23 family metallopeptidase [Aureibaculum marinum]|uniref:M23 family metallopeptidase n=1 Tax=Aureibaculum marinum TaxID=2487930 RepID=A0A3N4NW48_9FLAO|nr:M23 family metallopeptidase [Aureibaculum marinum]RPD96430.1 M23 family metallopeptidase [Aureibaculum marinum]
MAKQKVNKTKIKEKLTFKYRFVVLNEDTFEERFSFKLNRLNVLILSSLFSVLLVGSTIFLIAFTPLKEYIPGYSSTALKKKATDLVYKVDSLEQKLAVNDVYLQNIQQVLTGKVKDFTINKDSIEEHLHSKTEEINLDKTISPVDSMFREEVEREDRFSVFEKATKKTDLVFFAPISGKITDVFNPEEKHYAIDIAVEKDSPVKAVADGTVIFSGFTADTGFVIIIEHAKGFLSVYKHNSSLHKEQGDFVESGEAIANAGSTGELSTGPHLHFELWNDGFPVDPLNFIDFK